jgi:hypothetical protein
MANTKPLLECIPKPEEVRKKLAQNLREARLLRDLLRVAERAERDRTQKLIPQADSGS